MFFSTICSLADVERQCFQIIRAVLVAAVTLSTSSAPAHRWCLRQRTAVPPLTPLLLHVLLGLTRTMLPPASVSTCYADNIYWCNLTSSVVIPSMPLRRPKTLFVRKTDSALLNFAALNRLSQMLMIDRLLDVTAIRHHHVMCLLLAASSLTSSSMSSSVTQSHDLGFVLFVVCFHHSVHYCTTDKYCLSSDSYVWAVVNVWRFSSG